MLYITIMNLLSNYFITTMPCIINHNIKFTMKGAIVIDRASTNICKAIYTT